MEDRRKFKRFPVLLNAQYLEDNKEEWKECSIIDVSREGAGMNVYTKERIYIDTMLQLRIVVPIKKEPIDAVGTLMWIREIEGDPKFNFIGGIKLITIDPEDIWNLLDYAYEGWEKDNT